MSTTVNTATQIRPFHVEIPDDKLAVPASSIPFGFTTFPGEIWRTPRSWVEASYPNVIYVNKVDEGGHFAAWEEPELFAGELRAAFKSLH
jgi:pimeloyl-ACP methyl ester carboxylesterase